ncbi:hypothetical protein D1867_12060 [Acidianus infernus]|uniref:PIN domain-containing protein n=1 Tax=Acidianus infernus TaxID=12915 RepID=A0A6A9QGQ7_ACIIN|nr:hypothetical protein [Acidianus infernus]MUM65949.1 hypothetical protein [Acidianus infernus]
MECAVIPINRSDFTFESAFSSVVRTYELVRYKKLLILYADFNDVHLRKLERLFEEFKSHGVEVVKEKLGVMKFDEFKKMIEDETGGCDKVFLVPTSGANIIAVYLTLLHSSDSNKYPLINYLFAFGPWIRYYYPFVPRSLEKALLIGHSQLHGVNLDLNLEDYVERDLEFTALIQLTAYELNKFNLEETNISLRVNGKEILNTSNVDYDKAKKYLAFAIQDSNIRESVFKLAGAYKILVDGEEIEKVAYGRPLLIDTNLIYFGIHTHEIRDLVIPYCVHNEVLMTVNRKDGEETFSDAVFLVYDTLRAKSRMLPSESTICDIAIPKIEADLIKNYLVVTADKRAYDRWKRLAISEYAEVKLASVREERTSYAEVTSVIFNLASILHFMKFKDVEVCMDNKCVKVDEVAKKLQR